MNGNYFWQPTCFQINHQFPTSQFIDQLCFSNQMQPNIDYMYDQLRKKVEQLELENISLKEQLTTLNISNQKTKIIKRNVKRRKQQQLDKKYRCKQLNCKKQYASSLALNLHIKTKHCYQKNEQIDGNRSSLSNFPEQQQNSKIQTNNMLTVRNQ